MGKLTGKVAVVTGASRGIGKAVAEAFTAAGATVVGVAFSWGCDVSSETDVEKLFERIERKHRRLDILVNNAGILTPRKPLAQVTLHEWRQTLRVNVNGVFLCTRAALQLMIPRRSGLIINLSSGAGKRPAPEWGPYGVSKWAVEGFTKTVAAEVQQFGIDVVAINPGGTRTQMRAAAYPDEDPLTLHAPEDVANFFVAVASGKIKFAPGDSLDYPGAGLAKTPRRIR